MNKRIGDLEFRLTRDRNPEIVSFFTTRTGTESCYTILWYIKEREGWEIHFVGERPLAVADKESLWKLMKYGQQICNAIFEVEEE